MITICPVVGNADIMKSFYPESRFGGFTDIDGTVRFYSRVQALLEPHYTVLDVGCGRGAYQDDQCRYRRQLRIFKGKCRRVVGIDVDPAATANPFLDEFYLLDGSTWPLADQSVDLCLADYVLEHVEDPSQFFVECERVLRQNGYLCLRTPNKLGYVAFLANIIPRKLHIKLLKKVQDRRQEQDVFPTVYRCNTIGKTKKMLTEHGFDHCVYGYDAEPQYSGSSRLLYTMAIIYNYIIPRYFKNALFIFARKR